MTTKATEPNKTVLSNIFSIPVGAEESFVHIDNQLVVTQVDESNAESEFGTYFAETTDNTATDGPNDSGNALDVPTDFAVVGQTLRRAPGGQQVVDVIVQAEDIVGATTYEFQVVKI